MAQYYAITKQEFGVSKITGAEMITLTLFDLETREEFRSFVDSSMENFCQWAEIITQPEKGWVVTGLKEKRNYGRYRHRILNADCAPVIVAEFPCVKKAEQKLRQQWAREDFEKTQYGRMFKEV